MLAADRGGDDLVYALDIGCTVGVAGSTGIRLPPLAVLVQPHICGVMHNRRHVIEQAANLCGYDRSAVGIPGSAYLDGELVGFELGCFRPAGNDKILWLADRSACSR